MLNPFPELLSLGYFAPTLLRVAVALALAYSAYYLIRERSNIHEAVFPIIGKPPVWMVWVSCTVTFITSIALLFGYGTQIAAIVGAIIGLKYAMIPRRLASLMPLSYSAYLLMCVICLSLLATGAGAWAMDLHL